MKAVATPRKMASTAISEDAETFNWQEIRKKTVTGGVEFKFKMVLEGFVGFGEGLSSLRRSVETLTCENSESTKEE